MRKSNFFGWIGTRLLALLTGVLSPKPPPQPTKTYTHSAPPRPNRRLLRTILCLPVSSSRHDGLGSRRSGLWREEWRISRCWDVLSALGPRAWATLGTSETERKFAARRFTSLSARARLPASLVLLDEVWSRMDEGMISAVGRYLTEPGGVGERQAVVVITHGLRARQFRI